MTSLLSREFDQVVNNEKQSEIAYQNHRNLEVIPLGKIIAIHLQKPQQTQKPDNLPSTSNGFILARIYPDTETHVGQELLILRNLKNSNLKTVLPYTLTVHKISNHPFFSQTIQAYKTNLLTKIKVGDIIACHKDNYLSINKKILKRARSIEEKDFQAAMVLYREIIATDPTLAEAHYGLLRIYQKNDVKNVFAIRKKFADVYERRSNFFDKHQREEFFINHDYYLRGLYRSLRTLNTRVENAQEAHRFFPKNKRFIENLLEANLQLMRFYEHKRTIEQVEKSIGENRLIIAKMLKDNLYTDKSLLFAIDFIAILYQKLRSDLRRDVEIKAKYREFVNEQLLPRIVKRKTYQQYLNASLQKLEI